MEATGVIMPRYLNTFIKYIGARILGRQIEIEKNDILIFRDSVIKCVKL